MIVIYTFSQDLGSVFDTCFRPTSKSLVEAEITRLCRAFTRLCRASQISLSRLSYENISTPSIWGWWYVLVSFAFQDWYSMNGMHTCRNLRWSCWYCYSRISSTCHIKLFQFSKPSKTVIIWSASPISRVFRLGSPDPPILPKKSPEIWKWLNLTDLPN